MGQAADSQPNAPRLAVSNWDYSWLTRTRRPADEYASLEQAFTELVQRGYNAIRIDPFPHLLARDPQGVHMLRQEILPHPGATGQGLAEPCKVDLQRALPLLLEQAHRHQVKVLLTSWLCPDRRAARSFVRTPADYVRIWSETLSFIEQTGFGRTVYAVDFANEFPAAGWHYGAYRHIFKTHPVNPLPLLRPWAREEERRVQQYLIEVPRALRALFPGYRFGVSCNPLTESHLRLLDTSELDFVDFHVWLSENNRVGRLNRALVSAPLPLPDRASGMLFRRRGQRWRAQMGEQIDQIADFADKRRLAWMVTEGFVVPSPGKSDWGWVREVSDYAVRHALDYPVNVLAPSSYARPHSHRFWSASRWHQLLTARIREIEPVEPVRQL